jgi:hypothetical protein
MRPLRNIEIHKPREPHPRDLDVPKSDNMSDDMSALGANMAETRDNSID